MLDRFAIRGRSLDTAGSSSAERLGYLIEKRGVARLRPPAWFQGKVPYGGFFITIDGAHVIPVMPAPPRDGVVPNPPYIAMTFVAMRLADEDLAGMTGEELSLTVALPPKVNAGWQDALALRGAESEELCDAIAHRGRATREQPSWLRTRRSDPDSFYVCVAAGIGEDIALIVRRCRRADGRGARFRATGLFDPQGVRELHGEALAGAVSVDPKALSDYRNRAPGVPDDDRSHLRARIAAEGGPHSAVARVGPQRHLARTRAPARRRAGSGIAPACGRGVRVRSLMDCPALLRAPARATRAG